MTVDTDQPRPQRSLWARITAWTRRRSSSDLQGPSPSHHLIDARTRTFWSNGAPTESTLIEAHDDASPERRGNRAALLERIHATDPAVVRPAGTPAFGEALFVELMRAQQFDRAFALLADDCQRAWGSRSAFARAQSDGNFMNLRGINVKATRYLPTWTDPERNTTHTQVAELDVDYLLDGHGPSAVATRTVHLVAAGRTWRSLCYPQGRGEL